MMASRVSQSRPDLAPEIIRTSLEKKIDDAEVSEEAGAEQKPQSGKIDDEIVWELSARRANIYRKVIDEYSDWHDAPLVAEQDPESFINVLWPIYQKVFEVVAVKRDSDTNTYRRHRYLNIKLDDDEDAYEPGASNLMVALREAIKLIAKTSPESFIRFVERTKNTDLMIVHRLLSTGLELIAGDKPNYILDYILEDKRRLALGHVSDHCKETTKLISTISPLIDDVSLNILRTHIEKCDYWNLNGENLEPKNRQSWSRANRADRITLIGAIDPDRQTNSEKRFIEEEKRALPEFQESRLRYEGGQIGSPMSKQQMEKAKNRDIINIINELPDETRWEDPKNWTKGGSVQLSREFEEFAKENIDRAIEIAKEFKPEIHEMYAASVIAGATKGDVSSKLVFGLIKQFLAQGFGKRVFIEETCQALSSYVKKGRTLNDEMLSLMESWLSVPEDDSLDDDDDNDFSEVFEDELDTEDSVNPEPETPESVIWGYSRVSTLPHGNFPILETISKSCLLAEPPQYLILHDILDRHLQRNEDPNVWKAILRLIKYLSNHDKKSFEEFITKLFTKYPQSLTSYEGAIFLAECHFKLSADGFGTLVSMIFKSQWEQGAQAFGELVCLSALFHPNSIWVQDTMKEILSNEQEIFDRTTSQKRLGVIYSAIHLWDNKDCRKLATEIITSIIPLADKFMTNAIMDVFRIIDDLRPDQETQRLLSTLCDHPSVFEITSDTFLIDKLPDLVPHDPHLVFNICNHLIDRAGNQFQTRITGLSAATNELIDIALTLHRLDGINRENGLTLFEKMIRLDLYEAKQTLSEIDGRRPRSGHRAPLPRRRRRR